MPKFTNEFGSVVNVDDATAERQGERWTPVEKPQVSKPAARTAAKK